MPCKNFNPIKFKMADLQPLLTLGCVISGNPCQIAMPCSMKFQLDQIQNGRLAAIIDFNICNIHGKLC